MTDPDRQIRLQRVRYRAWRRGFAEADLALGRFADTRAADLGEEDLDLFEALLGEADQDIYDWIIGRAEPPARYAGDLMTALRAAAAEHGAKEAGAAR